MSNYNAAPGWYPDGQGNQRYWDGAAWSEHVTPMYPGGGTSMPAAAQTPLPTKAQPLAAADLIASGEEITNTIEAPEGKVSITSKNVVISEANGQVTLLARSQVTSASAAPNDLGGYSVLIQAGGLSKTISAASADDAKVLIGLAAG
ncbi:MAG: DUF2510 domain-containing protein [Nocardioidaceae bacterium]|nr:DUF2510 domain-containing protein [Marmoricola sp.]